MSYSLALFFAHVYLKQGVISFIFAAKIILAVG